MKTPFIVAGIAAVAMAVASQFLTIFVIQPIGAIPDGVTIITSRREKTKFIDSADAVCLREFGQVNLFCRMGVMGGIAKEENGKIYARLPYVRSLYLWSTGGKEFSK
jgi:hypothetical protein